MRDGRDPKKVVTSLFLSARPALNGSGRRSALARAYSLYPRSSRKQQHTHAQPGNVNTRIPDICVGVSALLAKGPAHGAFSALAGRAADPLTGPKPGRAATRVRRGARVSSIGVYKWYTCAVHDNLKRMCTYV